MANHAYEGSEVPFTAAYLMGFLRALQRHIGIADTRTIKFFLDEVERLVERDKAYHVVAPPDRSS